MSGDRVRCCTPHSSRASQKHELRCARISRRKCASQVRLVGSIRPYLVTARKWYSETGAGPGADADGGPGGDHQLGTKTGFPRRTRLYPRAVPSAAAWKTQGARGLPPIPLDRLGGTPSVHSGRFPPLTGGCFLRWSSVLASSRPLVSRRRHGPISLVGEKTTHARASFSRPLNVLPLDASRRRQGVPRVTIGDTYGYAQPAR